MGYAGTTGCAPAAGTYSDAYVVNFDDATLGAITSGKFSTITMAGSTLAYKVRMSDGTGEFNEKYNGADANNWDSSASGLLKSLAIESRNAMQDHAGAKLVIFLRLKAGGVRCIGYDDGAYLDTNDASSKTGAVGEAFKYTAKGASIKAPEFFHTDAATTIADLEALLS
jgi:hypothetical protein